jgi:hypothetical protein
MRHCFAALITIGSLAFFVQGARAGLMLSLSAESPDPSHLGVGQTVRFDVTLSGLKAGDQLDYLAGTVTFDSGLLGSPTQVAPGAIIPDMSGFVGTGFVGAADAFYDAVFFSLTNTPITTDGTFYTFDVVTRKPGTGSLSFDLTSLAAADGTDTPVPLGAGPPLDFTILPSQTAAVPEPGSLAQALTALFACAGTAAGRSAVRRLRQRFSE